MQDIDHINKLLNRLVKSIRRAQAKGRDYPRYYIPIIVNIVRSSTFDFIWFDKEIGVWRAVPPIFDKLYIEDIMGRAFRGYSSYEVISLVTLNEVLYSIDVRRHLAVKNISVSDLDRAKESHVFRLPSNFSKSKLPKSTGNCSLLKGGLDDSVKFLTDKNCFEHNLELLRDG